MTSTLREVDIASLSKQAIIELASDEPVDFRRSEMKVTLPAHGEVPCDAAFIKGEHYGVAEFKVCLSRELEAQALRWASYVNYVWIGYRTPQSAKLAYEMRRMRLVRAGVGIVEISGETAKVLNPSVFQDADTRLFAKAFHSHSGEFDPPAGTKTGKRMTPARCQYENASKTLKDCKTIDGNYGWMSWLNIKRANPQDEFIQNTTPKKATQDCKRGIWRGPELDDVVAPAVFRWKAAKK